LAAWVVLLLLAGYAGGSQADFNGSLVGTTAAPSSFSVRNLGPGQGLSHSHALSVLQDREGFLWVGTRFGLNRFDAYECVPFFHDGRNPNGPGTSLRRYPGIQRVLSRKDPGKSLQATGGIDGPADF
jgi:hypothetical protein